MPIVVPTTTDSISPGSIDASAQRRGDGRDGVGGIGRHLREEGAAVVVDRDQVGERPAGVDAHPDPHQRNVRPPSIRMVWPVTKALSREARKTSRPTRSSGCS